MKCIICDNYFKKHAFNQSNECDACIDIILPEIDPETEIDVVIMLNPSGRTPAVFYEDGYGGDPEESRDSI